MGFYDLGRDLADDFYNDEDYLDGDYLDDEEEEEERADLLLWPQWLHPDCPDPCTALDLGTCCKYPTEPVVRRAVELTDSVERTLSRAGREQCAVVPPDWPGSFFPCRDCSPRSTRCSPR